MIGFLHRQLWQRLPYGLRRAALFRASTLAAPRPARGVAAAPPLVVAGALRTATGLGHAARLSLAALRAAAAPVSRLDLTDALRQTRDLELPEGGTAEAGAGTLLVNVNGPLMGLAMLGIGRRLAAGKRIVGVWNWELARVPEDWRLGVGLVHEIWVSSHFTAEAIAPIADGRPVHVVPLPVAVVPAPARPARRPAAPFTVLALLDAASSLSRKNPEGVISAFREAFGSDPGVRLVLKTQRLAALPDAAARLAALADAPNIEIRDVTLDEAGMEGLYAEADTVISLHRAEGFGLSMAEAMRRGIPAIGTGWSGSADFLTEATGLPVPWRLVPVQDAQRTYDQPGAVWAEPDVTAAAAALVALREDPDLRRRLGQAGMRYAATHWTAEAYVARLREVGAPA